MSEEEKEKKNTEKFLKTKKLTIAVLKMLLVITWPFIMLIFLENFVEYTDYISKFLPEFPGRVFVFSLALFSIFFGPSILIIAGSFKKIFTKILVIIFFLVIYIPTIVWWIFMIPCITDNKCL